MKDHHLSRSECARRKISWKDVLWKNVIFKGKTFNLEDLYGMLYHW